METKIDKIIEDLHDVKVHLAVYNSLLEIHIKRTEILESKIEPVEKHVSQMTGAFKFLGVLSVVLGIIATIYKILH